MPVCTTQIYLPVTNSQELLIEPVPAKVLGTTDVPEEQAGSALKKYTNKGRTSNQWG